MIYLMGLYTVWYDSELILYVLHLKRITFNTTLWHAVILL